MIHQTPLDAERAKEISNLHGGNGLTTAQSEFRVAERLAQWREHDAKLALRLGVVVDGVFIQATGHSYSPVIPPDDALSRLERKLEAEVDSRETRG
jgi:hypothetical protein